MDEIKVRKQKIQDRLDRIERLKNLQDNQDFKLFLEEVLRLRDNYYNELSNFSGGKGLTMEQNYLRIVEAQLRYESYNSVLTLINAGINRSKGLKKELETLASQEAESK